MPMLCLRRMSSKALGSSVVFVLLSMVVCTPPEDPITCSSENTSCTITNSYGMFPDRSICHVAKVLYPTTEQELVSVVASATKNKTKMKVATLKIDVEARTMTVVSGVTMKQLINEAAKAGLALPYAPYWWGLTIGGLMGTGAHGSTLWGKGSSVHDYVVGLTLVRPAPPQDGYAKLETLTQQHQDLDAAKVSLGVLGVISQVRGTISPSFPTFFFNMITLKLEPLFKRSITYLAKDDSDLGEQVTSFGHAHEFADITWYPSHRKALYRVDHRVPINTSGNGLYDFIPFRPTPSLGLALIRTTEDIQESTRDADGKCISSKTTTNTLVTAAYGLTNNGILFSGYPVIGFQNRLQASGSCLDSLQDAKITTCAWDSRVKGEFFHQTTFSISLSVVKNFIEDVQKLVELEPKALCGIELYNGILMRYVKASSAYLGKQEDALDFDITYYRSKDPLTPRLYEDILEEVEQIGIFKYGGLPHWGKNRNLAFVGAIKKYKNAEYFLRVKDKYDSQGLFSSTWTDQVLGLKDGMTILKDGCALEGLCICSQDTHCNPTKGYYCRPGKVYKEARQ
ncbi:putative L-gulonolactone oxidase 6, partial [Mucuna pruriens]